MEIKEKLEIIKHITLGTKEVFYKNKDWLYNQYINNKKSTFEIAEICGCSEVTIWRWLKRFNIKTRSLSEAAKISFEKGKIGFQNGENHPNWKGIENYDQGYKTIWNPSHPKSKHKRVKEHVLIIEENIKRNLKKEEIIHHINGIRDDNRIENLWMCNYKSHGKAHKSMEKIVYNLVKNNIVIFDKKEGIYVMNDGD